MRWFLMLCLSVALSAPATELVPIEPKSEEVGRYQLVAADMWEPATNQNRATIFKIDTVTGEVWRLERVNGVTSKISGKPENLLIEGWLKMDADFWLELHKFSQMQSD